MSIPYHNYQNANNIAKDSSQLMSLRLIEIEKKILAKFQSYPLSQRQFVKKMFRRNMDSITNLNQKIIYFKQILDQIDLDRLHKYLGSSNASEKTNHTDNQLRTQDKQINETQNDNTHHKKRHYNQIYKNPQIRLQIQLPSKVEYQQDKHYKRISSQIYQLNRNKKSIKQLSKTEQLLNSKLISKSLKQIQLEKSLKKVQTKMFLKNKQTQLSQALKELINQEQQYKIEQEQLFKQKIQKQRQRQLRNRLEQDNQNIKKINMNSFRYASLMSDGQSRVSLPRTKTFQQSRLSNLSQQSQQKMYQQEKQKQRNSKNNEFFSFRNSKDIQQKKLQIQQKQRKLSQNKNFSKQNQYIDEASIIARLYEHGKSPTQNQSRSNLVKNRDPFIRSSEQKDNQKKLPKIQQIQYEKQALKRQLQNRLRNQEVKNRYNNEYISYDTQTSISQQLQDYQQQQDQERQNWRTNLSQNPNNKQLKQKKPKQRHSKQKVINEIGQQSFKKIQNSLLNRARTSPASIKKLLYANSIDQSNHLRNVYNLQDKMKQDLSKRIVSSSPQGINKQDYWQY